MDKILIRNAQLTDVPKIAEVEQLCFPIPWSAESIAHDIANNDMAMVIVAEVDGLFAGYADIWCIAGEGQLNNIAVMPEMRGKRVGLSIMRELIARLKATQAKEISLEVRIRNLPAISLYEKLGFEVVGRREAYYLDNGDDALIMKLDLSEG